MAAMAILSKQSALELQRIVEEATGRKISLGEAYAIWHDLIKLLQLLWHVERRQKPLPSSDQLTLFANAKRRRPGR